MKTEIAGAELPLMDAKMKHSARQDAAALGANDAQMGLFAELFQSMVVPITAPHTSSIHAKNSVESVETDLVAKSSVKSVHEKMMSTGEKHAARFAIPVNVVKDGVQAVVTKPVQDKKNAQELSVQRPSGRQQVSQTLDSVNPLKMMDAQSQHTANQSAQARAVTAVEPNGLPLNRQTLVKDAMKLPLVDESPRAHAVSDGDLQTARVTNVHVASNLQVVPDLQVKTLRSLVAHGPSQPVEKHVSQPELLGAAQWTRSLDTKVSPQWKAAHHNEAINGQMVVHHSSDAMTASTVASLPTMWMPKSNAVAFNHAGAPTATQTLSMTDANPEQTLSSLMVQQIQTGPDIVKVQVHPEGMGNIVISVAKQPDGAVQLQVTANQMSTMQWLSTQVNQIADVVRHHGIDLSGVQVQFGQADLGQRGAANSGGHSSKRQRQETATRSNVVEVTGPVSHWSRTQEYLDWRNGGISIQV